MDTTDLDLNCMTFTRFVLEQQASHPNAHGDLTNVMLSIQTAVKATSAYVRRAGIDNHMGMAGETNVQGEDQKKLDVISNQIFINLLKSSYNCCMLVSEENETVIEVEDERKGKYIVTFDPLDGSSNIDCLVSIGSIFGIFSKPEGELTAKSVLQSGRHLVASGYALYGSATMMVVALNNQVNGFMLEPSQGEFLLIEKNMRIPDKGKIYSINEGYRNMWDKSVLEYVEAKQKRKQPARYIGSMVADVHRTIKYGGIFLYPATETSPSGKLRVLYECLPMAHIVETAGGKATTGKIDMMDYQPKSLHERAPIFLGSKDDVDEYLSFVKMNEK